MQHKQIMTGRVVDAVQFRDGNGPELLKLVGQSQAHVQEQLGENGPKVRVVTLAGELEIGAGDWLVKWPDGTLLGIFNSYFAQNFAPVTEEVEA